jgi:hypothetical protein
MPHWLYSGDEVMAELFGPDPDGNEIVPQKLAKLFRFELREPSQY